MLSTIVFLPLVGALIIGVFLRSVRAIKTVAVAVTSVVVALALGLLVKIPGLSFQTVFDLSNRQPQFVERYDWIPQLGIHYFLGVDGLSLPMVLLTALIGFGAVLASWHISFRHKEYFVWLLVLETGVLGVFTSLDFFLFFLFWEVDLVPMFLLISIWGSGRREYSAMKFLIYTILGSAFMLVGILILYFTVEPRTTDIIALGNMNIQPKLVSAQAVFFLLIIAFAIKLPVWPFHTWLPDAHTDAPTAVSVVLAGVLLKMGGYGIIRITVSILPDIAREFAWLLAALAVINIVYGALVTIMQTDLKRMIAFSSISHMGYVLLGIASLGQVGMTGAALQMFTHGTITGLLFMLVGLVYEKAHTRHIPDLGGLAHRMPLIAVAMTVGGLASLGLPSMSGFVAELTVFLGSFPTLPLHTIVGIVGIVLTAGYILWMLQRVLFGPAKERFASVTDAAPVDAIALVAMIAPIIVVGVYPRVLTDIFNAGILPVIQRLG